MNIQKDLNGDSKVAQRTRGSGLRAVGHARLESGPPGPGHV